MFGKGGAKGKISYSDVNILKAIWKGLVALRISKCSKSKLFHTNLSDGGETLCDFWNTLLLSPSSFDSYISCSTHVHTSANRSFSSPNLSLGGRLLSFMAGRRSSNMSDEYCTR